MSNYLKVKTDSVVAYKLQGECYEKLNYVDLALESYHQSISLADKKKQSKQKITGQNYGIIKPTSILNSSVVNTITKENKVRKYFT